MRDRRTAQPNYMLIPIIGRIRGDGEVEFYEQVTESAQAPEHIFRAGSVRIEHTTDHRKPEAGEREAG